MERIEFTVNGQRFIVLELTDSWALYAVSTGNGSKLIGKVRVLGACKIIATRYTLTKTGERR